MRKQVQQFHDDVTCPVTLSIFLPYRPLLAKMVFFIDSLRPLEPVYGKKISAARHSDKFLALKLFFHRTYHRSQRDPLASVVGRARVLSATDTVLI